MEPWGSVCHSSYTHGQWVVRCTQCNIKEYEYSFLTLSWSQTIQIIPKFSQDDPMPPNRLVPMAKYFLSNFFFFRVGCRGVSMVIKKSYLKAQGQTTSGGGHRHHPFYSRIILKLLKSQEKITFVILFQL